MYRYLLGPMRAVNLPEPNEPLIPFNIVLEILWHRYLSDTENVMSLNATSTGGRFGRFVNGTYEQYFASLFTQFSSWTTFEQYCLSIKRLTTDDCELIDITLSSHCWIWSFVYIAFCSGRAKFFSTVVWSSLDMVTLLICTFWIFNMEID